MALARLERPRRAALRRLDPARPLQGRRTSRSSRSSRPSAPTPPARSPTRSCTSSRRSPRPGVGACGGQFTANTMAMAFEVLGLSPMGSAMVPAAYEDKNRVATEAGALIMDVLARGQRPRDIITREGLENAIAAVATSGGSTNGVLHLLALAREAGVELDIDDFDRIAERTPTTCDLKPGGRFVAKDLYEAGGIGVVAKRLLEAGHAARGRPDRHRPHDRRARARGAGDARPGGRAPASTTRSRRPAASRSCAATSRPRAPSMKLSGHERVPPRGPARVFECEEDAMDAVTHGRDQGRRRRRHPQRGPGRRPRHARDARGDGGARRRRASARRSRCSPTAASPAPPAASWSATSRPRRSRAARSPRSQDGDTITIDVGEPADGRRPARRRRSPAASPPTSRRRRPTPAACWPSTRSSSRAPRRAPSPARPGDARDARAPARRSPARNSRSSSLKRDGRSSIGTCPVSSKTTTRALSPISRR